MRVCPSCGLGTDGDFAFCHARSAPRRRQGAVPALVLQTATLADDTFLLYDAAASSMVTQTLDRRLGEPTVVGDVLVAIGGLQLTKPAEPVSVFVR